MLLKLQHPNIIRVRDVFKAKGNISTVFEYCSGDDFKTMIDKSPGDGGVDEDLCMKVFVQCCLGVKMCHSHDIIHKNLSLDHILFVDEKHEVIRLCGFGTTREDVKSVSVCSNFTGKYGWVPPETVIGAVYTLGADIWGLGVILSIAIKGKMPYF